MAQTKDQREFYSYQDRIELAKACLVGLCANFEAPHHRARELAAKALDAAQAFYDELDAREAANEAKEAEAGPTEPPAQGSPFEDGSNLSGLADVVITETPLKERTTFSTPQRVSVEESLTQKPGTTERISADRPWTGGDLARG